jgi:hypothetical protein
VLSRVRYFFATFIIIVSTGFLVWGIRPNQTLREEIPFTESELVGNVPGMDAADLDQKLAWDTLRPGDWILVIEYPSTIRRGDPGIVTLTFVNADGSTQSGDTPVDLSGSRTPVEILDYSDPHLVMKSRLDLADIPHSPTGELIAPLKPGVPVKFSWKINSREDITATGTIWLYLQMLSTEQSEIISKALSAQELEFKVVSMLGLTGAIARIIGVLGIALGFSLSMDIIGKWVKKIPDHLRNNLGM